MTEVIRVGDNRIEPIVISEEEQLPIYAPLFRADEAERFWVRGAEAVLDIMLSKKLTLVEDRQAVWYCMKSCLFTVDGAVEGIDLRDVFLLNDFKSSCISCHKRDIHQKIGAAFPPGEFEGNCKFLSVDKVDETIAYQALCSHQRRNPEQSKWGGSHCMVFKLVAVSGKAYYLVCASAPSGLKEYEDLAMGLGIKYYNGLVRFEHSQVQNILAAADASVAGQAKFLPEEMTITEYVKSIFDAIDADRLSRLRCA